MHWRACARAPALARAAQQSRWCAGHTRRIASVPTAAALQQRTSLAPPSQPSTTPRLVLGIESSFDDTGVAVVDTAGRILAEKVCSQRQQHMATGGTVPHLAGELHRRTLPGLCDEVLAAAGIADPAREIAAVACTIGPGLAPCLDAGVTFAKDLSARLRVDFIPVHHMEAHLLTARLVDQHVKFPFLVLLASGGHCMLVLARKLGDYLRLGTCRDDAPGEAFDKVARAMGLDGGARALEQLAAVGDARRAHTLKTPMQGERSCDFSFAGLKTSACRHVDEIRLRPSDSTDMADVAAAFQTALVNHIAVRCLRFVICDLRSVI